MLSAAWPRPELWSWSPARKTLPRSIFLPDNHIVVIAAEDVAGDYETVFARIRDTYGKGEMPRTVNLITGPSRSADIEQTLLLGAHGPRRLHIVVVTGEAGAPEPR